MNCLALFFKLPLEIRLAIFEQLTPQELAQIRLVSKGFNDTVENKSLWHLYLKPGVIKEATKNNQSFSALFGAKLEGLTQEGLLAHPVYEPLYQSLKEKVDARSFILHKIELLEYYVRHNFDEAYIILSSDYFRSILLENVPSFMVLAREMIKQQSGVKYLVFQWLFQPEVQKVLAADVIWWCIKLWLQEAEKSLEVAWFGLENNDLLNMLEELAIREVFLFTHQFGELVNAQRDQKLTLFILQRFMQKETFCHELADFYRYGLYSLRYMSDAVQLTDDLNWPDDGVLLQSKKAMCRILLTNLPVC